MKDTISFTFVMPKQMHAILEKQAQADQRTLAAKIRIILEEYLKLNK